MANSFQRTHKRCSWCVLFHWVTCALWIIINKVMWPNGGKFSIHTFHIPHCIMDRLWEQISNNRTFSSTVSILLNESLYFSKGYVRWSFSRNLPANCFSHRLESFVLGIQLLRQRHSERHSIMRAKSPHVLQWLRQWKEVKSTMGIQILQLQVTFTSIWTTWVQRILSRCLWRIWKSGVQEVERILRTS